MFNAIIRFALRQRLLVAAVSQVFVMGGDRKQFQVLVDPDKLLKYGVTLHEVKAVASESNRNATGGYLDERGPHEFLVRSLGRIHSVEDLQGVVVKIRNGRSVSLGQVARVIEGPQVKRGGSTAFVRIKGRESRVQSQVGGGPGGGTGRAESGEQTSPALDSRLSTLDSRLSTLDSQPAPSPV